MLIGVTGASSAFGQAVCRYLTGSGHDVQRLVRVPLGASDRAYDIHCQEVGHAIRSLDAVVHLAWERRSGSLDSNQASVRSTERLAAACSDSSIQFIQISSTSVIQHSVSQYGAAKLAAENLTCSHGGVVLRPGLVWGSGMFYSPIFRQLATVADMPAVLPLLKPDPLLFHTEISTFCQLLLATIVEPIAAGSRVCAYANEQLTLSSILSALRTRRRLMTVSLPTSLCASLIHLLNKYRLSTRIKEDSLEFALQRTDDGVPDCSLPQDVFRFADNHDFLVWLANTQKSRVT